MMNARNDGDRHILSERRVSRNNIRLAANTKDAARMHASRYQSSAANEELDHVKLGMILNQNLASATSAVQQQHKLDSSAQQHHQQKHQYKLDTIASSDSRTTNVSSGSRSESRSMGSRSLSFELHRVEGAANPRSSLRSAPDEWYHGQNDRRDELNNIPSRPQHPTTRDVEPPPPPPPPPPPQAPPPTHLQPSSYVRLNESDNRSVVSSNNRLTVTRTFSQSQKQIASLKQQEETRREKADHKKALLSVLQQLKDSETANSELQTKHENEKSEMLQQISKKENQMNEIQKRLEKAESKLESQKRENVPLLKVLTQLSNFANGCQNYAKTSNSTSVKKMSEALKVQVNEWAKCHEVDLASEAEGETEKELSSLEMIQSLQMEVKKLQAENAKLRKRTSTRSSSVSKASSADSSTGASSTNSQGSKEGVKVGNDESDEVSHLSGMTSLSGGTKMSASTFPTDFDDSGQKDKLSSAKGLIPPPPPPRMAANKTTSSSRGPPRPAGTKVRIHATPQILTNEEDSAAHEDNGFAFSPRSIMRKPTYSKGSSKATRRPSQSSEEEQKSSQVAAQGKADMITQGFANFDQAFTDDVFANGYSEV